MLLKLCSVCQSADIDQRQQRSQARVQPDAAHDKSAIELLWWHWYACWSVFVSSLAAIAAGVFSQRSDSHIQTCQQHPASSVSRALESWCETETVRTTYISGKADLPSTCYKPSVSGLFYHKIFKFIFSYSSS